MVSERNQAQSPSVDLQILPFKHKHFQHLLHLHETQQYDSMHTIIYRTLPKVGFIAMLGDQPIAAGFLRRLEPCYAQLDTLVSNGYFGAHIRHVGIANVVDSLINEAKRLKLEGIIALTTDAGILKRANSLGFKPLDTSVIALPVPRE